jgi:hypothetical protein
MARLAVPLTPGFSPVSYGAEEELSRFNGLIDVHAVQARETVKTVFYDGIGWAPG